MLHHAFDIFRIDGFTAENPFGFFLYTMHGNFCSISAISTIGARRTSLNAAHTGDHATMISIIIVAAQHIGFMIILVFTSKTFSHCGCFIHRCSHNLFCTDVLFQFCCFHNCNFIVHTYIFQHSLLGCRTMEVNNLYLSFLLATYSGNIRHRNSSMCRRPLMSYQQEVLASA